MEWAVIHVTDMSAVGWVSCCLEPSGCASVWLQSSPDTCIRRWIPCLQFSWECMVFLSLLPGQFLYFLRGLLNTKINIKILKPGCSCVPRVVFFLAYSETVITLLLSKLEWCRTPTFWTCSSCGMNDVPTTQLVWERLLHRPGTLLDMQLLFLDLRSEAEVHVVFRCLGG